MSKTFKSAKKMDSLPIGAEVRFGVRPYYGRVWRKEEKGWRQVGNSYPIPWDAKTVLAYEANREYYIEKEQA